MNVKSTNTDQYVTKATVTVTMMVLIFQNPSILRNVSINKNEQKDNQTRTSFCNDCQCNLGISCSKYAMIYHNTAKLCKLKYFLMGLKHLICNKSFNYHRTLTPIYKSTALFTIKQKFTIIGKHQE